jgi:hypothetical protein
MTDDVQAECHARPGSRDALGEGRNDRPADGAGGVEPSQRVEQQQCVLAPC